MTEVLKVEQLTKKFSRFTGIENLNFTVKSGEIVGLLGPNGAGKTTTFQILSGLMPADSGRVYIDGESLTRENRTHYPWMAFLSERNPLPENFSVTDYLLYRARLKGILNPQQAVESVLQHCDLQRQARHRRVGKLSKGFRQRVGIADALLGAPKLLLLDEPTIGLDPYQIHEVRELLVHLQGQTLMISSHVLSELEAICSRFLVLNGGKLVADGTLATLTRKFLPQERISLLLENDWDAMADIRGELHRLFTSFQGVVDSVESLGEHLVRVELDFPRKLVRKELEEILGPKGIKILEYKLREKRLEDLFLAITKRHWEEKSS